jgi:hypothetical protein
MVLGRSAPTSIIGAWLDSKNFDITDFILSQMLSIPFDPGSLLSHAIKSMKSKHLDRLLSMMACDCSDCILSRGLFKNVHG